MFIVYRTTNLLTGEFYIGVHKTDNPDDGYLGSGRNIKKALAVYGPEHFKRETLEVFDTKTQAYELERSLVDPLLGTPGCLNLHPGGCGGFHYINRRGMNVSQNLTNRWVAGSPALLKACERGRETRNRLMTTDPVYAETRRNQALEAVSKARAAWTGSRHSASTRGILSNLRMGTGNPMYGLRWVHNPQSGEAMRVVSADVPPLLSQGWGLGRKPPSAPSPRKRRKVTCLSCGNPHPPRNYEDPTSPVCRSCKAQRRYDEAQALYKEGGYAAVAEHFGVPYKTAWDWVNASRRMGRSR